MQKRFDTLWKVWYNNGVKNRKNNSRNCCWYRLNHNALLVNALKGLYWQRAGLCRLVFHFQRTIKEQYGTFTKGD